MTSQPPQDEVEEVARAICGPNCDAPTCSCQPTELAKQICWQTELDRAHVAIATIDRLRSAAPTAEGWRPIETAPRDGTPVALYAPTRREPFQCGFWIWESDDNDDPLHGVWWLGDGRYEDQPVAWMPLPTPPKDETHG